MMSQTLMSQTVLPARSSPVFGSPVKAAAPSRTQGRRSVTVNAAERQLWYPGGEAPKHLNGSLPGDYGFDPLSLASEEKALTWFQQAELVHCRTAMAAVAGIVIPGLLSKIGILPALPTWTDAGKVWIESHPSFPLGSLLFTQFLFTGWVEGKRWADLYNPGSQGDGSFLGITGGFKPKSNGYPGGPFFDPLGFSRGDAESYFEYQTKEVKNGRLAMLAFLGFFAQYAATGKGPIDNLFDHIANPGQVNFATNGVSLPFIRR